MNKIFDGEISPRHLTNHSSIRNSVLDNSRSYYVEKMLIMLFCFRNDLV